MGTHPIFESDFDCLTDLSYGPSNLFIMVFEKFVSIGGVVFSEAHQKTMAVVNVISLTRLLCDDGNCGRYEVNVKNIRLENQDQLGCKTRHRQEGVGCCQHDRSLRWYRYGQSRCHQAKTCQFD